MEGKRTMKNPFVVWWTCSVCLLAWIGRGSNGSGGAIASATVVVPAYNRSFASMPALFGGTLPTTSISARLQLLPNQRLMCRNEDDSPNHESASNGGSDLSNNNQDDNNNDDANSPNQHQEQQEQPNVADVNGVLNRTNSVIVNGNMTLLDDESLPVALLVQRGKCTFHEKAIIAANYYPTVQYVVVYDNERSNSLVPMSSEYPLEPPADQLSLLFVSYRTGMDLKNMIMEQSRHQREPSSNHSGSENPIHGSGPDKITPTTIPDLIGMNGGGLLIELDGTVPEFLTPANVEMSIMGYLFAAMLGFLSFLIFFLCILLCAQAGWISARADERGRLILFAGATARAVGNGDASTTLATLRGLARGLLTEEQVKEYIPEEEFVLLSDSDDEDSDDESEDGTDSSNNEKQFDNVDVVPRPSSGDDSQSLDSEKKEEDPASDEDAVRETKQPTSPLANAGSSVSSESMESLQIDAETGNVGTAGSVCNDSQCSSGNRHGSHQTSCAICLDDFEEDEKVRVLPCHHKFHGDCVIPWLTERDASCPLCKFDVMEYIVKKMNKKGDSRNKTSQSSTPSEEPISSPTTSTNNSARASGSWFRLRRGFGGWTLLRNNEEAALPTIRVADDENAVGDRGQNEEPAQQSNQVPETPNANNLDFTITIQDGNAEEQDLAQG